MRMAAGELLCQEESLPVILDDIFGMYEEEDLEADFLPDTEALLQPCAWQNKSAPECRG